MSSDNGGGWIVIGTVIALMAIFIVAFSDDGEDESDDDSSTEPNNGDAFTLSSQGARHTYQTWRSADLDGAWAGPAAAQSITQNALLGNLADQIADISSEVQGVVQTQAHQVNDSKATLRNVVHELNAAIPLAKSLYYSGPSGPALSYQFQLAVSSPALSTGTNTTHHMHGNAEKNAVQLRVLAQRYDDAFTALPYVNDPNLSQPHQEQT
ncbi:MAG: hypothetical protein K2Q25_14260 [Mycobacteriaceae bacterium]|nr:hypothetical protein [Mycobacteriaceae bacterium]